MKSKLNVVLFFKQQNLLNLNGYNITYKISVSILIRIEGVLVFLVDYHEFLLKNYFDQCTFKMC